MWKWIIIGILVGCDAGEEEMRDQEMVCKKWSQEMTDCSKVEIKVTSRSYWGIRNWVINGCGMKVCCGIVRDGASCFRCEGVR
jgi:hypothetical protein